MEAYVAVEICFGPLLVEEAVRKKSVYRNIVAWRGGPLDLSNGRHVKNFWTGTVSESETKVKKQDESMQLVKSASLVWRVSKSDVKYEGEGNIDYVHCHREKLDDVRTLFSIINQRNINLLISDWNESKGEESVKLFPDHGEFSAAVRDKGFHDIDEDFFPEHEEFSIAVLEEEFDSCEKNQPEDIGEDLFPEHKEFLTAVRQEFDPCERNQSRDEDDDDLFPEHEQFSAAIREEES